MKREAEGVVAPLAMETVEPNMLRGCVENMWGHNPQLDDWNLKQKKGKKNTIREKFAEMRKEESRVLVIEGRRAALA